MAYVGCFTESELMKVVSIIRQLNDCSELDDFVLEIIITNLHDASIGTVTLVDSEYVFTPAKDN